ncbi:MAG TPA: flagellar motor protein MotP [Bacilli bacterium]|nr:flagellar motor protein MotP [Bacilli bacterium]
MKKNDLLTPIGIFIGITVLFYAIFSGSSWIEALAFIDFASFLVVFGGVAAAIIINFSKNELKALPRVMRQAFKSEEYNYHGLIDTFVDLSGKARREGLLALEAGVEDVEDPFLKKGVLLAVDGVEADVIKDIMMAEVVAMEDRHRKGRMMIEKMGEYAPAWGMIGTLVGLILMLNSLNDPASLGPKMAIALITTLYGALLANLIFLPIASKLENKTEEEAFVKQLIVEGVIGVQSGQNPKILEEKLSAFIPKEIKTKLSEEDMVEEHVEA